MPKTLTFFNHQELQQQAMEFTESFNKFLDKYPELKPFCNNPIDHLAIKAYGNKDFEEFLNSVLEHASPPVTYTPMDGRKIATALLNQPFTFQNFGSSNVLEIIEPKPEKAEKSDARFDHIEIRNPHFEKIEKVLNKLSISYKPYANPKHRALVIAINDQEQEIKFTDGNLSEIVKKELAEGTAQKI